MRLSEAIRLGALISWPTVGAFLRDKEACALGAALLAMGTTTTPLAVFDRWKDDRLKCALPGLRSRGIAFGIVSFISTTIIAGLVKRSDARGRHAGSRASTLAGAPALHEAPRAPANWMV